MKQEKKVKETCGRRVDTRRWDENWVIGLGRKRFASENEGSGVNELRRENRQA